MVNVLRFFSFNKLESEVYTGETYEWGVSNLIDFDWKKILTPPPKNSSETTKRELELIQNETNNRNRKDLFLVYGHDEDIDQYYIDLMKKNRLIYPQPYIDFFYNVTRPVLMNLKNYYNRPRPIQLAKYYDLNLDVVVTQTIHTPSYPSGHTFYSALVANILSDKYPSLKNKFEKIKLDTAKARIKQGVHYPSDNNASVELAEYVYQQLKIKVNKIFLSKS